MFERREPLALRVFRKGVFIAMGVGALVGAGAQARDTTLSALARALLATLLALAAVFFLTLASMHTPDEATHLAPRLGWGALCLSGSIFGIGCIVIAITVDPTDPASSGGMRLLMAVLGCALLFWSLRTLRRLLIGRS